MKSLTSRFCNVVRDNSMVGVIPDGEAVPGGAEYLLAPVQIAVQPLSPTRARQDADREETISNAP